MGKVYGVRERRPTPLSGWCEEIGKAQLDIGCEDALDCIVALGAFERMEPASPAVRRTWALASRCLGRRKGLPEARVIRKPRGFWRKLLKLGRS